MDLKEAMILEQYQKDEEEKLKQTEMQNNYTWNKEEIEKIIEEIQTAFWLEWGKAINKLIKKTEEKKND